MNIILDEIEIVENVLTPEDFVRLRTATGFADIPLPHATRALKNGLWRRSYELS
jgi:hypothetical protein